MRTRVFQWGGDLKKILDRLSDELTDIGIDFEVPGVEIDASEDAEGSRVKVVVLGSSLKQSVEEMGQAARDQVVMVRVDEDTVKELDAWVETGAVKSRSEAAALFIREGLKVRDGELGKLRDAIQEVEEARSRLHDRVKEVFGDKG